MRFGKRRGFAGFYTLRFTSLTGGAFFCRNAGGGLCGSGGAAGGGSAFFAGMRRLRFSEAFLGAALFTGALFFCGFAGTAFFLGFGRFCQMRFVRGRRPRLL